MVTAYTGFHVWAQTATEILYGTHLNEIGSYLSAVLNAGITAANVATSGIGSAAIVSDDLIGEAHINHSKAAGVRLLQVGHSTAVTGQLILKGVVTATTTATDATYVEVAVTFSNADCYAAGDVYGAAPHVDAYIVSSEVPSIGVKSVTTNGCTFIVDLYDTAVFTEAVNVYWRAMGNMTTG